MHNPKSLEGLSKKVAHRLMRKCIEDSDVSQEQFDYAKRYYQRSVNPVVQNAMFYDVIPLDPWTYSCLWVKERVECHMHLNCRLLYRRCSELLHMYFTTHITHFQLDLKNVQVNDNQTVIKTITGIFAEKMVIHLRTLILNGYGFTDHLLPDIEELCRLLSRCASKLAYLHLPIINNQCCKDVSSLPLRTFIADRTRHFSKEGFFLLCAPESKSMFSLKRLHIGMFKRGSYRKSDIALFLTCMKTLNEFSFFDENRHIIGLNKTISSDPRNKIFAYSIVRTAIIDAHFGQLSIESSGNWECHLRQLKVIDRQLKPKYLLKTCPHLKELIIDWQQEFCLLPFTLYKQTWFSDLLSSDGWIELARKLTQLCITFPSTYSRGSYSLPLTDCGKLFATSSNLTSLKLVGAGKADPVPLLMILQSCDKLLHLFLENTEIIFPEGYDGTLKSSVKKFHLVGCAISNDTKNQIMTDYVSHYMPVLTELIVQPTTIKTSNGLTPSQIRTLSRLKFLYRFSLCLSIHSCIMNLPELVYIFKKFISLTKLIVSWGYPNESYDVTNGKISYMMDWLQNAFRAENVDIELSIASQMHPHTSSD